MHKVFSQFGKAKKKKSTIQSLKTDKGKITDPTQISRYINNFYTDLYKSKQECTLEQCTQYLASVKTTKINENDMTKCEGLLTTQEVWESLTNMNNDMSPGNDRLTPAFFGKSSTPNCLTA
jgi:folate-binding Fe-S cluster repair protein YgfZ